MGSRRVGLSVLPIAAWGVVSAFVVALFASACGQVAGGSTSPSTCRTSSDCRSGATCLFSSYASCGTLGSCFLSPDGTACDNQSACACDGTTTTVCLVGGNSPAPIAALGSCDGATQQGYDAAVADAHVTVPEAAPPANGSDAAEASAPSDDAGQTVDSAPGVDAADATTSLLGTPCNFSSDCAGDPVYNQCKSVPQGSSKICTTTCVFTNAECQPPANGACDTNDGYCVLQ